MAKNNMVATDISSDSSSTIAQQKLKKFWTRGFQEKMAHVLAMCISFKMVKYHIYIYRKQRVPDIWRTSNQSKIEHRWVRTNPTNQGRIYDYVFSSNRKKVNSLFFPFMATLKKHIAPGFFMKRRGKRSSGISFSFVFVRTELGFAFAKLVPALDHEARVSQENSQWKTPVNHLPYSGPRTPTPP